MNNTERPKTEEVLYSIALVLVYLASFFGYINGYYKVISMLLSLLLYLRKKILTPLSLLVILTVLLVSIKEISKSYLMIALIMCFFLEEGIIIERVIPIEEPIFIALEGISTILELKYESNIKKNERGISKR